MLTKAIAFVIKPRQSCDENRNIVENAIAQLKSFYTLELFIMPGGRKAHLYAFGSIAEVQRALEVGFCHAFELYTLLVYGEDIYLSIYARRRNGQSDQFTAVHHSRDS